MVATDTVLLVSFRADWLRRKEAMKTAERENRNRWPTCSAFARMAGRSEPTLFKYVGWKQENSGGGRDVFS